MTAVDDSSTASGEVRFEQPSPGTVQLSFAGSWRLQDQRPAAAGFEEQLGSRTGLARVVFVTTQLRDWDSALLTYLARVVTLCRERNIEVDASGLPEGARRLLELAFAVAPKQDTGKHGEQPPTVTRIGMTVLELWRGIPEMISFIGELTQSLGRFLTGRAQYRRSDLLLVIQDVGPSALPIVSIISFLVGLIVAYMGAVQLAQFGAQIYIADLVAIGMVREMGALMTGIIMAGRTGAAFAAQLGTMQVNEEIDAFRTLGISPMDFLVLPRLLALVMMVPLLTVFADILGIFGGMLVGVGMFDIPMTQYLNQTLESVSLSDLAVGLFMSLVFAVIIAVAGCYQGLSSGRSSAAVGEAATAAVVSAIVGIVVADAIITLVTTELGI